MKNWINSSQVTSISEGSEGLFHSKVIAIVAAVTGAITFATAAITLGVEMNSINLFWMICLYLSSIQHHSCGRIVSFIDMMMPMPPLWVSLLFPLLNTIIPILALISTKQHKNTSKQINRVYFDNPTIYLTVVVELFYLHVMLIWLPWLDGLSRQTTIMLSYLIIQWFQVLDWWF